MTVTNEAQWHADGSPWHPAACIDAFRTLMQGYGFTVYVLGDESHLSADPPEDHTPYSATSWPGPQPYPAVLACDVMPGGRIDWRDVGQHLVDAKNAGVRGTEWIKYINFTAHTGACQHASWEPSYAVRSSSDTGHVHISARTDFISQTYVFDPVAAGGTPPPPRPTPTSSGDSVTTRLPLLRLGAQGAPARNAQALLADKGYNLGATGPRHDGVDGDWGPKTDAALRQFQVDRHVPNSVTASGHGDGQLGENTWAALLDI